MWQKCYNYLADILEQKKCLNKKLWAYLNEKKSVSKEIEDVKKTQIENIELKKMKYPKLNSAAEWRRQNWKSELEERTIEITHYKNKREIK